MVRAGEKEIIKEHLYTTEKGRLPHVKPIVWWGERVIFINQNTENPYYYNTTDLPILFCK